MKIGGLQRFSLLDYPEHISAIIFTKGCNFRCGFCYNPMLVWPNTASEVKDIPAKGNSLKSGTEKGQYSNEDDLFRFLETRVGKLDGVVITGGEPTIHADLPKFIKKIKALGFKIKLDTNGTNPEMLNDLINKKLLDYIAMDIKSSKEAYEKAVGTKVNFKNIEKSVKIIRESGLPYEFRTTLVRGLIAEKELKGAGEIIKGAEKWFLQKFNPDAELLDENFKKIKPFVEKEMEEMCKIGKKYVKECSVR